MILNELTNEDAIEAAKEEAWEEASKAIWQKARQHLEEERQHWQEERQHLEAAQQHWEEERRQQMIALIDQGLSGEQLKQALQCEPLRTVSPAAKTESSL
jgi:TPP-dependent indolepyruvate ferredoxin oxidoreductase alpha subunit